MTPHFDAQGPLTSETPQASASTLPLFAPTSSALESTSALLSPRSLFKAASTSRFLSSRTTTANLPTLSIYPMSAHLKAQSTIEHERWLAMKAGDRQKGKRVPRCSCSWCVDARVHAGRGRTGRIAIRVDDHEVHGTMLSGRDVEHELYMEAVRVSTAPSSSPRTEVPLSDLIREPRSRRKVDILDDFEIIRPTRAVLALDDDGFHVSNRHVGRDDFEDWEDVGMVSEGKGPAKLVATSARSYAEVLLKA